MDHVLELLLGPGGVTVLSLLILFGGWKKWWIFGWQYRELVDEKNEWKAAALKGTHAAERAVELVHTKELKDGSV